MIYEKIICGLLICAVLFTACSADNQGASVSQSTENSSYPLDSSSQSSSASADEADEQAAIAAKKQ